MHQFAVDGLVARVDADGAELVSLAGADGRELLWQAGPEWPRHAPVLFPIVGRLAGDVLRHDGQDYPMTQHGFARDRRFTWVTRHEAGCTLALTDDAATRAAYPFAFRLEITYALRRGGLDIDYAVHNPGAAVLPASLGAHPAFAWPLIAGEDKAGHTLRFAEAEPGPVHRLAGGLLAAAVANPIRDNTLRLDEALFADDALVMTAVRSRSLTYAAPGGAGLHVSWDGFPQLGVWSKPGGAAFLCIEPWHGHADPVGFDGPFIDKPGVRLLAPGETWRLGWRVAPG